MAFASLLRHTALSKLDALFQGKNTSFSVNPDQALLELMVLAHNACKDVLVSHFEP